MHTAAREQKASARNPSALLVPRVVSEVLLSPGQPLDTETRTFFEPRFGYDFSRVRVHADARAAESARAVNALAYTVGEQISFAAGQYSANTSEGRRLLAHELTHVVQQTGGSPVETRVRPLDKPAAQMPHDRVFDHRFSAKPFVSPHPTRSLGVQRKASLANGSISEELNLAERVLNSRSAGETDFVLNGSTFTAAEAGLKVLRTPRIGSAPQGKDATKCWFASVPTNTVSFAMRILSPGVWSYATTKAKLNNLFPGLNGCGTGGNATFLVNGMPTNDDQRKRTRTHEQRHVDDYKTILNDVIVPWDKAVSEAKSKRKSVVDSNKDQCGAKLYAETVGADQEPEDVVGSIINNVNEKARLFHASQAGRNVNISNVTAGKDCNTVTAEAR